MPPINAWIEAAKAAEMEDWRAEEAERREAELTAHEPEISREMLLAGEAAAAKYGGHCKHCSGHDPIDLAVEVYLAMRRAVSP
ncbi:MULTISPECIES: hypothetical protein [unclassified Chelatococcus]|uniref:hypothetical protein n=1 Tax=unclassified Chelatococcus TaxID=2638111 RepID=UPI001BCA857C|nr:MULTISPECIES: hypothetical protein [unclassified Chelatococcus]MBS7697847.1 hypothetical protein [Chelatococcus sp. YT9]MBX3559798.1 hypothetical protein [Chelatococcus sp.]